MHKIKGCYVDKSFEEITNLDVIEYLESIKKNPSKFYLGVICKRDHNFNNLGLCIRYKATGSCEVCHCDEGKIYRQENKDKMDLYLESTKEHRARIKKEYQEKHKEELARYHKIYRCENDEKLKTKSKDYYETNKEKLRADKRQYRKENEALVKQRNKQYYEQNKETVKQYREENKECYLEYTRKRRAIKHKSTIEVITPEDIINLKEKFNGNCAYCNIRLSKVITHLDHVQPISKQGKHSIDNIVPACSTCNLSKKDNLLSDWYKKQTFFSERHYRKILIHIKDYKTFSEYFGEK